MTDQKDDFVLEYINYRIKFHALRIKNINKTIEQIKNNGAVPSEHLTERAIDLTKSMAVMKAERRDYISKQKKLGIM